MHFQNATKSVRDFVARCLDQCSIMPKGKKRKIFKNFRIHIVKSSFFEVKTYEKLGNFFHHFLRLTCNHAQSCRRVKKGKILKNFQFHIVKSPFFDVKTYVKLTCFIVFLDWHKIMLNHAEGKRRENFK